MNTDTMYEAYSKYQRKPFTSYKGIPIERTFHGYLGRRGLTGRHVYTAIMPDGSSVTRELLKEVKREIISRFAKEIQTRADNEDYAMTHGTTT